MAVRIENSGRAKAHMHTTEMSKSALGIEKSKGFLFITYKLWEHVSRKNRADRLELLSELFGYSPDDDSVTITEGARKALSRILEDITGDIWDVISDLPKEADEQLTAQDAI